MRLVSCIPNSLQFVAPKMPQGEARGGRKWHMWPTSNEALGHFRRNPQGRSSFRLPLRCSLLTDHCGYARRSSPRGSRKSLAANCKLFGIHDTSYDICESVNHGTSDLTIEGGGRTVWLSLLNQTSNAIIRELNRLIRERRKPEAHYVVV